MAKIFEENHLSLRLFSLLFSGSTVEALSYDYVASIGCLEEPLEPQYGGGILVNPEINQGLKGWSAFGRGKIESKKSVGGNNFVWLLTLENNHLTVSHKRFIWRRRSSIHSLEAEKHLLDVVLLECFGGED